MPLIIQIRSVNDAPKTPIGGINVKIKSHKIPSVSNIIPSLQILRPKKQKALRQIDIADIAQYNVKYSIII